MTLWLHSATRKVVSCQDRVVDSVCDTLSTVSIGITYSAQACASGRLKLRHVDYNMHGTEAADLRDDEMCNHWSHLKTAGSQLLPALARTDEVSGDYFLF